MHRPANDLPVGRPFLQYLLRSVPVSAALLELAKVEPEQRVRVRLAAFVRDREEVAQEGPSLIELPPPEVPLDLHAIGVLTDRIGRLRDGGEALGHVVDRLPTEAPCPGQGIEGRPLVGIGAFGLLQGLERPGLRLCQPCDASEDRVSAHPRKHGGMQSGLVAALLERAFEEVNDLVVVRERAVGKGEPGTGTQRAGRERIDLGFEALRRAFALARMQEIFGPRKEATAPFRGRGRRQAHGMVGEVGRLLSGRPGRGCGRRGRHDRRHLLVGTGRGKRKVTRAQLTVADDPGELEVELPAFAQARVLSRGGGDQRMRGSDPAVLHDEDAGVDGVVQRLRLLELCKLGRAQVAAEGNGEQEPAYRPRKPGDPGAEQVLDGIGKRKLLADCRLIRVDERPSDLEREQRIAERRVRDSAQEMAREAEPEPVAQHAAKRAEAERLDVDVLEPRALECGLQRCRSPGAAREQEPDSGVPQPARGVGERLCGLSVEPLQIVDGDEHWLARSEVPQRVQTAHGVGMRLGSSRSRLGPHERHLERMRLRVGQSERLHVDPVEQVDQGRERELCVGLARSCREHAAFALARRIDAGLPQRRLSDPRPACENDRALRRIVQECSD